MDQAAKGNSTMRDEEILSVKINLLGVSVINLIHAGEGDFCLTALISCFSQFFKVHVASTGFEPMS